MHNLERNIDDFDFTTDSTYEPEAMVLQEVMAGNDCQSISVDTSDCVFHVDAI